MTAWRMCLKLLRALTEELPGMGWQAHAEQVHSDRR